MLRKISREMSRIKRTKTQAVALIMAGTIALSSVLGPSIASADAPGRDSTPSFGTVSEDLLSSSRPLTLRSLTGLERYHALIRHATYERVSIAPLPSPKPTLDVERISLDVGPSLLIIVPNY